MQRILNCIHICEFLPPPLCRWFNLFNWTSGLTQHFKRCVQEPELERWSREITARDNVEIMEEICLVLIKIYQKFMDVHKVFGRILISPREYVCLYDYGCTGIRKMLLLICVHFRWWWSYKMPFYRPLNSSRNESLIISNTDHRSPPLGELGKIK